MKKVQKSLIVTAFCIALVGLYGCDATTGDQSSQNTQVKKVSSEQTTKANSEASVSITDPKNTQNQPQSPAKTITLADQAAFDGAIKLEDTTYCDKIKDEDYKKSCKTTVSDNKIEKEALSKLDAAQCAKLSTSDKQEACKTEIDVANKQKQAKDSEAKAIQDDNDKLNAIIAKKELASCSSLKDDGFKVSCELNILVNEAMAKKDLKVCEKASLKTTVEECKKDTKI